MSIKILAVVVLYNESLYDSLTYSTLLSKNEELKVFVYDNSPYPMHKKEDFSHYIYVHDPHNNGLSVAYNKAAFYASSHGYQWILLLDQDTQFQDSLLDDFRHSIMNNPHIYMFAPILCLNDGDNFSPLKFHRKRGISVRLKSGVYTLPMISPVNSGLLISVEKFIEVGGYNSLVRLDFSDFQFIERFSSHYDKFFLIDSIGIQNFSNNVLDKSGLKRRFKIYCECALACDKHNWLDLFNYLSVVLRHSIALSVKSKDLSFFTSFIVNYLFKTSYKK